MYGFIIKKSFCDDWDNLLTVVLANVIYVFAALGGALAVTKLVQLFASSEAVHLYQFILLGLLIFVLFLILNILAFAFGEISAPIADFNSASILDFFKAIPGVILDALLYSLLVLAIGFISVFSIKFYIFDSQSKIGLFMGGLLFWIDIFVILSLQWFIPLRSLMHNNFRKCLKKCFLISFDNTGFSILVLLHSILLIVPSVFPFFGLFPGMAGITINKANALRIRMYKYDYLEEHPEQQKDRKLRKKIPWEELIYEDRETLGPRKLKSFIFPWKNED